MYAKMRMVEQIIDVHNIVIKREGVTKTPEDKSQPTKVHDWRLQVLQECEQIYA